MKAVFISILLANAGYFIYRAYVYVEPVVLTSVHSNAQAESIYLLSENSNENLREKEMDLVVNNPLQTVPGTDEACVAIGPLDDVFKGQAVVDRLVAVGLVVEMKALDIATGESDYRVMMPPAASLQGAFRKLRELKSQGIDSYVITQGRDALSISLGVFSTREAALSLQRSLLASGYEVDISAISRLSREFWVFPEQGRNLELGSSVWASLVDTYPDIERRARPCLDAQS